MNKNTFYFARDAPWLFSCQHISINLSIYQNKKGYF